MSMPARGAGAGDPSARTRIRDAALRLFRAEGVAGTGIRDVAREAGVSSGLVQHYYRSKEVLRAACDAYVLSQIVRIKEQLVLEGGLENPAFLGDSHPELLDLYRYLARSMIDGSPAAADMFTEMVAATEQWLARHHAGVVSDEHGYATLLVAMEIGALALHHQLSAALGSDVLGPEGHLRLARAKVEFYSKPLLDADLARQAVDVIDAVLTEQAGIAPHEGGPDGSR
ncbi:MAG: TetR/AcrR family transcriptional regulator [Acidimicrobiales bacterium]